jgi:predicted alpha/beta superfamily hydrolase
MQAVSDVRFTITSLTKRRWRVWISILYIMSLSLFVRNILARTHLPVSPAPPTLTSRVEQKTVYSKALGLTKRYLIYLPVGYDASRERYPVVYFFRGHEREWFNQNEDGSRNGITLKHIADSLIAEKKIGKMILVGVSTASEDNTVPCLGVNMLSPKLAKADGVGTGKYEDYILEVMAHIDKTYRTIPTKRGVDGFSLGGFTSVTLGIKHPEEVVSVGAYDGTFMWKDFDDPRKDMPPPSDQTWTRNAMFAPAFGAPRDIAYMKTYNVGNLLEAAGSMTLKKIQRVKFHIQSAAFDGDMGNIERAEHLLSLFSKYGITNSYPEVKLTATAQHNWHHANLYAAVSLVKHWTTFELQSSN